jgi:xylulokinase
VVEGVTYALADSAGIMRDLGLDIRTIRATGGGARSLSWRQLQADVLEARVVTALADAGPAFGAALIAAAGVGAFPSLQEAVDRLVKVDEREGLEPDPSAVPLYRRQHRFYASLYPAMAERFRAAELDR